MRFIVSLLILCSIACKSTAQTISRQQRIEIQSRMMIIRNSNDPTQVLALTGNILKIDSSFADAIAYRALAFSRKGQYEEALAEFDKYFRYKPRSPFCIYRAETRIKMSDTVRALRDIDSAMIRTGYDQSVNEQVSRFMAPEKRLKKVFERSLELHPDDYMAMISIGIIKEESGDLQGACENYANGIKLLNRQFFFGRIEHRYFFSLHASAAYDLKSYAEAINAISQAILLYPEQPKYYRERISFYMHANERKKACADLMLTKQMGETYYPKFKCDYNDKECQPSASWLAHVEAEKIYKEAYLLYPNTFDLREKAIFLYSEALELKPDHVYALAARAYCYMMSNQTEEGIKDLNKILKIDSVSALIYNYRSAAYAELRDLKQAVKDADKAVSLEPGNAEYYINRASVATRMGDTTNAIANLSRAISLNPFLSKAYFERGILEIDFKNNTAAAIKDFLKAIEIEENNPLVTAYATYYNKLSMAYNKLGDYDKALDALEKAIALKPSNAAFYYRCGEIKARMKNMTGACEDWNIAKQLGDAAAEELLMYNCKDKK